MPVECGRFVVGALVVGLTLPAGAPVGAQETGETSEPSSVDKGPTIIAPIIITAGRREQQLEDVPRAVRTIDNQTLEAITRKSTNFSETLPELIPGFGTPVFQNSTRSLTLRGREALFLLDGIPISAGEFGVDLGNFDPLTIDRVEVLYGPTALYGNGATGGVIQFFTREASPDPFELRTRLGVSSFGVPSEVFTAEGTSYDVFAEASGTVDRFSYLASVSFESTNGFFEPDGDRIAPGIRLDDTNDITFFGKAGVDLTDDQRLVGFVNFTRLGANRTDFISVPGNDGNAVAAERPVTYSEEPRQRSFFANLTYEHADLADGTMRLQGYYRDEELTQDGADLGTGTLPPGWPRLFQTNFDGDAFGFRGDYSRRFFDRVELTVGG
ncbi:MAG: TonB-dependent receptor plug domain-containing protein, partial [Pseudomonadota bacterium]